MWYEVATYVGRCNDACFDLYGIRLYSVRASPVGVSIGLPIVLLDTPDEKLRPLAAPTTSGVAQYIVRGV